MHIPDLPEAELDFRPIRAQGPGGQNVNKVESKVDLRFDLEAADVLPEAAKAALRRRCARRLDAEGRLVVTSQKTRDRPKNLADAREKLRLLILAALAPVVPRTPTKPSRAAVKRRLSNKRKTSEKKTRRRAVETE